MKRVRIEAVLEYEPDTWHGNSEQEKKWFYEDILGNGLTIHSNFIGDTVGELSELKFLDDEK